MFKDLLICSRTFSPFSASPHVSPGGVFRYLAARKKKKKAHAPPPCRFILCIVTVVFSIIVLGISGHYNCSNAQFVVCGATGMGITTGVFGMVLGGLGIAWLLVTELWDVGILKFVVAGGLIFVSVMSFITGVLWAYIAGPFGPAIACAIFAFFNMVTAAVAGIFCWMAGGGGTATG